MLIQPTPRIYINFSFSTFFNFHASLHFTNQEFKLLSFVDIREIIGYNFIFDF